MKGFSPGRSLVLAALAWLFLLPAVSTIHGSPATRRSAQDAEVLEEDDEKEGSLTLGNPGAASPSSPDTPSNDLNGTGSNLSGATDTGTGATATGTVTSYGYSDDSDMDTLTQGGTGIRDDQLTPHTVALSDSLAQSLGAQPGDAIEYTTSDGTTAIGTYLDRAPESSSILDVYSPNSSNSIATSSAGLNGAVTVRDLGGGSSTLSGSALSQLGESNALAAEQRLFGNR